MVGYTNAGKSTLFNVLSGAGVVVDNGLFSTLDAVTRRIRLPGGAPLLISDTVGFIQKLPHTVVAAFRATLEELHEADLLLHIIDITHRKAPEQAQIVSDTLRGLGLGDKPQLLVLNKLDVLTADDGTQDAPPFRLDRHPSVAVSALRGWNLDALLAKVEHLLTLTAVPSTD